ncbi:MAG: hypothetical protein ABIK85_03625 [Candidatus Eisenbacteria bacterium]
MHVTKLRHVIVNVGGGRLHLDTAREQAVERVRRVVAAVLIIVVVVVIVVLWRMGLM